MVRNPDRQVGIEQAFTDRLYEIQWIDFAHGRLPPLLMKGLILDSRNNDPAGEAGSVVRSAFKAD
jgi:hypothetical protein